MKVRKGKAKGGVIVKLKKGSGIVIKGVIVGLKKGVWNSDQKTKGKRKQMQFSNSL